jgi:hypothetical protein
MRGVRGQEDVNTLALVDGNGQPIAVGDEARVLTIPKWLTHDLPEEEVASLKAREGTIMRVLEIDPQGYVWFGTDNSGRWFCLRPSEVGVVRP